MTTFGELKIVPSVELGQVGSQQGEPVYVDWKWSYSAPGLVIWVALILAMILPKANRHKHILLILVPLVSVNLLWLAIKKVSGMPSSTASQFGTIFHATVVGITVLWLVMHCFHRLGGIARCMMAFGILMVISFLGLLSYSPESSQEVTIFSVLFSLLSLTIISTIALASRRCRGQYRPLRFMLWLALWTVVSGLLTMYAYFIIVMTLLSSWAETDILMAMLMLSFVGLILGLCLFILNLPFMILGFKCVLFRERFKACLGLTTIPTTPKEEAACD